MIRVLIVDDEKLVRQGLITSLPWEAYGMQVVGEAKNGEKAIEFLEQNEVDLMLTDLAMPVMSGIELMRHVRKRYPQLYIIVLTLHQDFEYIQEALRLGAIDYIAKVELTADRFAEILARVRERIDVEEQKKTRFEDKESDRVSDVSLEVWMSPDWILNDGRFHDLLEKLRSAKLTAIELNRLLHKLIAEWNELYASVLTAKLEAPPTDEAISWQEAADWLMRIRVVLSKALSELHYSQEVQDAVRKAVQLIQEELGSNLYAADIAKRVNMSRSYFSQCFKDITGRTFNEFVRQARMDKAKEYLEHTNMPILWVAEKTGYQDGKYFSSVFRDQTGELPSAYRKNHRKE